MKIKLITFFLLINIFTGCTSSDLFYKGADTDHFNGESFYNPWQEKETTFWKILPVLLFEERGRWIKLRDLEPGNPPPAAIDSTKARVTFIGHSTTLIQTHGLNILTDPVWSDFISPVPFVGPRAYHKPGIRFEDLPKIHIVVISHNHYDHMDLPTLLNLNEFHNPQFLTPVGNKYILEEEGILKVTELDWWGEWEFSKALKIHLVPAQHFSGRWIDDRNKSLWGGFIFNTPKGNIYFAGDTGYANFIHEISEKFQPIVLSLLPIGAYEPNDVIGYMHVNPEESVQMHLDLKSRKSAAIHFGRFPQAWESMIRPIGDLQEARKKYGLSKDDFQMIWPGKYLEISF